MPTSVIWIAGRHPFKQQWLQNAAFSKYVREQLVASNVVPVEHRNRMTADVKPAEWSQALSHVSGCVVGIAVVRPLWAADVLTYLGPAEREQHDFLSLSETDSSDPIVFLEILQACPLEAPIRIGVENLVVKQRGHWSFLTRWTLQRCVESRTVEGCSVAELLQVWGARYILNVAEPPKLTNHMVSAHCVLILAKIWRSYAFVYAAGRRGRGVRCALARPLLQGLDLDHVPQGIHAEVEQIDFSPDLIQQIADTLRLHYTSRQRGEPIAEHTLFQTKAHIKWLQSMRDDIVKQQFLQTRKVYAMSYMLECLVFSGYLRSDANFRQALESGIRASVHEKVLATFFLERLRQPSEGVRIKLVDDALRSSQFWAYMTMLDRVAGFLLEVALWAEGCGCHTEQLRVL